MLRKQKTSESYRSGLLQRRGHLSEADYETKAGLVTGERVEFYLPELKMAPTAPAKFRRGHVAPQIKDESRF